MISDVLFQAIRDIEGYNLILKERDPDIDRLLREMTRVQLQRDRCGTCCADAPVTEADIDEALAAAQEDARERYAEVRGLVAQQ